MNRLTVGWSVAILGITLAVTSSIRAASSASHPAPAAHHVRLFESGSSLLYPLFNIWLPSFSRQHPNVQLTTQSTGSGTGISEALQGQVQIGASDAYLANSEMKQHPGVLNVPLAISAQQINYNIPGLNKRHLNLNGPVLAAIYSGTIRYWDDRHLAALNPGVRLPHHLIIPVHRSDSSGDTFLFTQYLSFSTSRWSKSIAYGTQVSWPAVMAAVGAHGNQGMVQTLKQTPYSIAYVGISYLDQTRQAGLGEAALQNKVGQFLLPTVRTIETEAFAKAHQTPLDMRISLVFAAAKNGYPIVNYEYAIVERHQASSPQAEALRSVLDWAISSKHGNQMRFLRQVHFVPLPTSIAKMSLAQVAKIRG